jgi:hypothetical protein
VKFKLISFLAFFPFLCVAAKLNPDDVRLVVSGVNSERYEGLRNIDSQLQTSGLTLESADADLIRLLSSLNHLIVMAPPGFVELSLRVQMHLDRFLLKMLGHLDSQPRACRIIAESGYGSPVVVGKLRLVVRGIRDENGVTVPTTTPLHIKPLAAVDLMTEEGQRILVSKLYPRERTDTQRAAFESLKQVRHLQPGAWADLVNAAIEIKNSPGRTGLWFADPYPVRLLRIHGINFLPGLQVLKDAVKSDPRPELISTIRRLEKHPICGILAAEAVDKASAIRLLRFARKDNVVDVTQKKGEQLP